MLSEKTHTEKKSIVIIGTGFAGIRMFKQLYALKKKKGFFKFMNFTGTILCCYFLCVILPILGVSSLTEFWDCRFFSLFFSLYQILKTHRH